MSMMIDFGVVKCLHTIPDHELYQQRTTQFFHTLILNPLMHLG